MPTLGGPPPFPDVTLQHTPAAPEAATPVAAAAPSLEFTYTASEESVAVWLASHVLPPPSPDHEVVLGFDAEWRPVHAPGVREVPSVLQLATPTAALVVQLNALAFAPCGSPAHGCLEALLGCRWATVAGMGIGNDVERVGEALAGYRAAAGAPPAACPPPPPLALTAGAGAWEGAGAGGGAGAAPPTPTPLAAPAGCAGGGARPLELKTFGQARGVDVPGGLEALTLAVAPGGEVAPWKVRSIQVSDWEAWPLDEPHVRYAAVDAWASLLCFMRLAGRPVVPAATGGGPRSRRSSSVAAGGAATPGGEASTPLVAGSGGGGTPAGAHRRRGSSGGDAGGTPRRPPLHAVHPHTPQPVPAEGEGGGGGAGAMPVEPAGGVGVGADSPLAAGGAAGAAAAAGQ